MFGGMSNADLRDPMSAMTPRFNLFFRWFAKRFFREISLDSATVARLRALEAAGSVVYVMRYASRLDYFLFNWLFVRHGLRLSGFSNGIHFDYYQPLHQAIPARWRAGRERRRLLRAGGRLSEAERDRVRAQLRGPSSLFVFLRTERLRSWLRGRRHVATAERSDLDLLAEVVGAAWDGAPVAVVPIALFWRKGPRNERRFLNLAYGAPTRPSDISKVSSFLANYKNLAVKIGEPIDLTGFARERRAEGEAAVVRKVRRSILVFLYREEKVVEGPALRPPHKVQETVLASPRVQAAIAARAAERGGSEEAARVDAEKCFREIAARMSSTLLAVLSIAITPIFRRLFVAIETSGLEKVAEYAKRHPIVLVPSHRSYFDFLLLSWLFYAHHLVPPHILARENMAFGPFGWIFRRAGAFFMRRSFDDAVYKEVFRAYVAYLVREGFTQEFFIEGARSRTGRTLAPKLGMLSWDVEGFLAAPQRRDLFFVPIAITYERLVEEGAMIEELAGAAKKDESMMGLVRARKVLQRRWGSAHVSFGEPISLGDALGEDRARFADEATPEDAADKRRFVEGLANRIVERINGATVANATAVTACAFLGETRRGLLRHELTARMQEIVDLLRLDDVRITPALLRDQPEFDDAIAFLARADLIRVQQDPRGEILYYDDGKRRVLDLYRNGILHFLAPPSFLARRLLVGGTQEELREDLRFWLDFFQHELATSRGLVLAAHFEAYLDYFERLEVVERYDGRWRASEKGVAYLRRLAMQTQGLLEVYAAAFSSVAADAELGSSRRLTKRLVEAFERADLLGEVTAREVSNAATFQSALDELVRRRILTRERPAGTRDPVYARGPAFEALSGLALRLAGALLGR